MYKGIQLQLYGGDIQGRSSLRTYPVHILMYIWRCWGSMVQEPRVYVLNLLEMSHSSRDRLFSASTPYCSCYWQDATSTDQTDTSVSDHCSKSQLRHSRLSLWWSAWTTWLVFPFFCSSFLRCRVVFVRGPISRVWWFQQWWTMGGASG